MLYVTHSNGETKVSIYDLPSPTSIPVFARDVDVGTDPFGICRLVR